MVSSFCHFIVSCDPVLHAHQLRSNECSLAIASCELGGEEYIIIGTGVSEQENYESTRGRLIVMSCDNGQCSIRVFCVVDICELQANQFCMYFMDIPGFNIPLKYSCSLI